MREKDEVVKLRAEFRESEVEILNKAPEIEKELLDLIAGLIIEIIFEEQL